jgi:hypothetical protein
VARSGWSNRSHTKDHMGHSHIGSGEVGSGVASISFLSSRWIKKKTPSIAAWRGGGRPTWALMQQEIEHHGISPGALDHRTTRRGKQRWGQHGAVSSRTEDAAASKRAYRGLRRDSSAATECVSALASCGLPPWARRGPPCWLAAQAATPGSRDDWALALRRGYDSYGFKRRKINIRETRSLTRMKGWSEFWFGAG